MPPQSTHAQHSLQRENYVRPGVCPVPTLTRAVRASPFLWQQAQAGESILVQKWTCPQSGQVHYTDASAGHQMISFQRSLTGLLTFGCPLRRRRTTIDVMMTMMMMR